MEWYSLGGGVGPASGGEGGDQLVDSRPAKSGRMNASLPLAEGGCGNCDGVAESIDSLPSVGVGVAHRELDMLSRTPARSEGVGFRNTKLGWLWPGGGGNCDDKTMILPRHGDVGDKSDAEVETMLVELAREARIETALAVK